jgi:multicomponent Na+:H+ antiporter subunit F
LAGYPVSLSIYAGETSFLDVAIAYALIAFLGTAALARFLMRSPQRKPENINNKEAKTTNNE